MDIVTGECYSIEGLSYMCIAKNEKVIVMAAYYAEDEDMSCQLDMTEVLVYDTNHTDYGPIEKIGDYSGKGKVVFEFH